MSCLTLMIRTDKQVDGIEALATRQLVIWQLYTTQEHNITILEIGYKYCAQRR